MRVVLFAVLALALSGCAGSGALHSRYLNPEPGVVYRYGNFCGAQFPRYPQGATREERLAFARTIAPIDSIDLACKAHDICYDTFEHDAGYCDRMFSEVLLAPSGRPTVDDWQGDGATMAVCRNLAMELNIGVLHMKNRMHDGNVLQTQGVRQVTGTMAAALHAPLRWATLSGFPETEGTCSSSWVIDFNRRFGIDLGETQFGSISRGEVAR